jgi:hypothetical protein
MVRIDETEDTVGDLEIAPPGLSAINQQLINQ